MKIVVVGGTGLIGTKVVELLGAGPHEVVAASRATGVNAFTGEIPNKAEVEAAIQDGRISHGLGVLILERALAALR